MELLDTHGQTQIWKAIQPQGNVNPNAINSIQMQPFTVNINKLRSHDKDRYLCLNLKIILKEYMAVTELPKIHPKAREAVIVYLSSLIYKDVKNLDKIEEIQEKLKIIMNPYVDNMIDKVDIDHVIVSSTIDRVEEFLIEHSLKARMGKKGDEKDKKENKE